MKNYKLLILSLLIFLQYKPVFSQYNDSQLIGVAEGKEYDTVYTFDHNNPFRYPRLEVSLFPLGFYSTPNSGNYSWMINTNYRLSKKNIINAYLLYPNISGNYYVKNQYWPTPNRTVFAQASLLHMLRLKEISKLKKHLVSRSVSMKGYNSFLITERKAKIPINYLYSLYTETGLMYMTNGDDKRYYNLSNSNPTYSMVGYKTNMLVLGIGFFKSQSWAVRNTVKAKYGSFGWRSRTSVDNKDFKTLKLYLNILLPITTVHREVTWYNDSSIGYFNYKNSPNKHSLPLTSPGIMLGFENQFRTFGNRGSITLRVKLGILPYPKDWLPFKDLSFLLFPPQKYEYFELAGLLNFGFGKYLRVK